MLIVIRCFLFNLSQGDKVNRQFWLALLPGFIVYNSAEVSAKVMFYVEQHYLSHSVKLADALIAATAPPYPVVFHY